MPLPLYVASVLFISTYRCICRCKATVTLALLCRPCAEVEMTDMRSGDMVAIWEKIFKSESGLFLALTVTTLHTDGFVGRIYLCFYVEDKKPTKLESPSFHLPKITVWKTSYSLWTNKEVTRKFLRLLPNVHQFAYQNFAVYKILHISSIVQMGYSFHIESICTQGTGRWQIRSRKKLRWNGARLVPLREDAPLETRSRFSRLYLTAEDWIRVMLAIIQSRTFCLLVCCLKM
jgi:hypothetical protein